MSRLVSALFIKSKNLIYTIDSDYLVRIWNLHTGQSESSHLLKLPSKDGSKLRITCAAIDEKEKLLAIANEQGEIFVLNIHSTGLLYQLEKINSEVTNLKFFVGATNLWIAASCWEGKVAFFTVPAFS